MSQDRDQGTQVGVLVGVNDGGKLSRRQKRFSLEEATLQIAMLREGLQVKQDFSLWSRALEEKDRTIDQRDRYIERLEKRLAKYEDAGASYAERAGKAEVEKDYLLRQLVSTEADREKWKEKAGDESWLVPLLSFGTNLLEAWKSGKGEAPGAAQLVEILVRLDPSRELCAQYIARMEEAFSDLPAVVVEK